MIDAVAVDHRAVEPDRLGEALAERRGRRAIAPDRQQRSDSRRSGAPRWMLPASTMCEARSRADGVTMRLRMPDGSMLTTGVSSKMRAPARLACSARPWTYLRPSI